MHEIDKIIEATRGVMNKGGRGVLVTVIATTGSTYRRAGARAVIDEHGVGVGMLSGGCVERDLAERVRPWLDERKPQLITYDSTRSSDILFGLGLGCRGTMELLIEPFDAETPPPLVASFRWNGREPVVWTTSFEGREILIESIRPRPSVAIFGSGADAEPVRTIGEQLGWQMTAFPSRVLPDDPDTFDAAIIMTHNFLTDLALLDVLLPSAIPYVGLLGPKQRGDELLAQTSIAARERKQKLRNPIGLDLGGETPEDIALSIVAEIQSVLNGRPAASLHDRDAAIHEVSGVGARRGKRRSDSPVRQHRRSRIESRSPVTSPPSPASTETKAPDRCT
jgi:Xanthine and CO dehydrogenases maturation factor, XdhC/CoxF family